MPYNLGQFLRIELKTKIEIWERRRRKDKELGLRRRVGGLKNELEKQWFGEERNENNEQIKKRIKGGKKERNRKEEMIFQLIIKRRPRKDCLVPIVRNQSKKTRIKNEIRERKRLEGGKKTKKMNKGENLHFTKIDQWLQFFLGQISTSINDQWLQLISTKTIYEIAQCISIIPSSRISYLTA